MKRGERAGAIFYSCGTPKKVSGENSTRHLVGTVTEQLKTKVNTYTETNIYSAIEVL